MSICAAVVRRDFNFGSTSSPLGASAADSIVLSSCKSEIVLCVSRLCVVLLLRKKKDVFAVDYLSKLFT